MEPSSLSGIDHYAAHLRRESAAGPSCKCGMDNLDQGLNLMSADISVITSEVLISLEAELDKHVVSE